MVVARDSLLYSGLQLNALGLRGERESMVIEERTNGVLEWLNCSRQPAVVGERTGSNARRQLVSWKPCLSADLRSFASCWRQRPARGGISWRRIYTCTRQG